MNTTLLFVEIFIAGLQGLIWISLMILTLTGYEWALKLRLQDLGSWLFLISALIFSFAYSLGIVIDRAANLIYSSWDKKIGAQYFPARAKALSVVRFQLKSEYLNRQLEYVRTRLRIARSSSLNYCLITVFSIGLISRFDFLSAEQIRMYCIFAGLFGFLLAASFVASWYSLTRTNYYMVAQNIKEEAKSSAGKKNA